MPQFDITYFFSQIFWLVLVFSVLYFVLSKFILPRASSIFSTRNRYLEKNISAADQYNREIESIEASKARRLEELNDNVEKTKQKAIENLESDFNKQKENLTKIIKKKRDDSQNELDDYMNQFEQNKEKLSIDLASMIIKKITNKDVDTDLLKTIYRKTT